MTDINKQANLQNDMLMQHFNKIIAKEQLAHAYLFDGPKGAGQEVIAQWLSMRLFCQNLINNQPCQQCINCQRIKKAQHPDVITVKSDKKSIKVDEIRILKQEFTKSAVEGNHKILIIQQAETMTISAQNSLLKFIEDPVGNVLIILLTENKNLLLPTIISRIQLVAFELPTLNELEKQLTNQGTRNEIRLALRLCGNLENASQLLQNPNLSKLTSLVWRWFNVVVRQELAAFAMIQTEFIPLIQDNEHQITADQVFDTIMFIFRDLLLNNETNELVFVDNHEALQTIRKHLSIEQRLNLIDLVLGIRKNQQMNISTQNILEGLTLEIFLSLENKHE